MLPGVYAPGLTLHQGADWSLRLTWKDDEGDPYNLTGWTAKLRFRDRQSYAVLDELTTEDGHIVLGGALGTLTATLDVLEIAAYTWTWATLNLTLIDPSGNPSPLLKADVFLAQEGL